MKSLRFVSMDPSLANTALVMGTIDLETLDIYPTEYDIVQTTKDTTKKVRVSSDTIRRVKQTLDVINTVLFDFKPHVCFAETPQGSKSSNAMKSYGVSCCYIAMLNPPAIEVSPIEVKKVIGIKKPSKKDIMQWAETNYPSFPFERKKDGSMVEGRMEHVADAIAIARAGLNTDTFNRLVGLKSVVA